jgi:hypothetical protein
MIKENPENNKINNSNSNNNSSSNNNNSFYKQSLIKFVCEESL